MFLQRKRGRIADKKYIPAYKNQNKQIITAVFVADDEKRQVVL